MVCGPLAPSAGQAWTKLIFQNTPGHGINPTPSLPKSAIQDFNIKLDFVVGFGEGAQRAGGAVANPTSLH